MFQKSKSCFILILFACTNLCYAGTVQFSAATFAQAENETSLTITVSRTGTITSSATVSVSTSDGTATAGSDYTAVTTVLSWLTNDGVSKTFDIVLKDDALFEGTETITLTLSSPVNDTLGTQSTAVASITDFEEGTLQFLNSNFAVSEDEGEATITVVRTNGSNGAVTVDYATKDDTAKAGEDYVSTSGTLSFADGETILGFVIPITNDNIGEIENSFDITLSTFTGNSIEGSPIVATVSISNDDNDFTGGQTALSITPAPGVTLGSILDLSKDSPFDSDTTILEAINRLPVLTTTGLSANQNTTGIVDIEIGVDTMHLYPYSLLLNEISDDEGLFINPDESGKFVTDLGLKIIFQPALAGLSVLQEILAEANLTDLIITDAGNISIQVDQGAPPLELDEDGELTISDSFYDRYYLRPDLYSYVAPTGASVGFSSRQNPQASGHDLYVITSTVSSVLRQQTLSPAPIISTEVENVLGSIAGVTKATAEQDGIISILYLGQPFTLIADYIIRRVPRKETIAPGVYPDPDLNGDGLEDLRFVYSNGDEQYFIFVME